VHAQLLWYLLHLKEQKSRLKCDECIRELENRNGRYSKTVIDDKLREVLDTKHLKAKNRAKKLEKFTNPSSTIYKLIEELEKFKNINK